MRSQARVHADRHVEAGDLGAAFVEFAQCDETSHHRQVERDAGRPGQHLGQRRQREVVTRGDDQAQRRGGASARGRGAEVEREAGQYPREPVARGGLRLQPASARFGEARAATALEVHERRAEDPLVVAQQSPRGAIRNAADDDCRGERCSGGDGLEQRQKARVDRVVLLAIQSPFQRRNHSHYAEFDIFG